MKIAVPFDNGEIFQHFGKTESFKLYEVSEDKIVSQEVVSTGGSGHDALADFLAERMVDVVICGGMGEGAQNALAARSIAVCAGAEGDADTAVAMFLAGELENTGANCGHHEEEEDCGHCGGGCGSCGGCHSQPPIQGKNVGRTVKTHYTGTFNDGTEFDSSYGRGEPLEFVCGAGMMIRGFDAAVANMEVGETVDVHLMPDEAYGYPDPRAVFTLRIDQLPGSQDLNEGEQVVLYNDMRQPIQCVVAAKDDTTITFDANHEMAGKELNFRIQLVEVQ